MTTYKKILKARNYNTELKSRRKQEMLNRWISAVVAIVGIWGIAYLSMAAQVAIDKQ